MKAVDISIKNRIAIIVLALILVISGAIAYVTIPKESNPDIDIPIYVITTIYPGIGPSDMESLVTQPIERELQGIEGIDEISSTTQESLSLIVVEFDLDTDRIVASQEVREQVDLARPELPEDVEEPIINEIDLDDFPIMTVNLSADYDLSRLTDLAEDLEDELETLRGVREVELIGGLEREVQVNVDLQRYLSYGTSFQQMIGAIQGQNLTIPGGTVDVDYLEYLLRISGEFDNPHEIEDLIVHTPVDPETGERSAPVYMRDLAEVVFGFAERESYATLKAFEVENNNQGETRRIPFEEATMNEVVSLDIIQRSGGNILETTDEVKELIAGYDLPAGTQVTITGDQSENVRTLISDLENSIISGMMFVILVLVFFLGLRNALLVGTAVPLAILVGFIVLSLLGFTVNFIILFSLIVALGLLVDNSIVVVENIYRYREMGYERFEAAKLATNEVGYALIAATLTLVAAFAPLLLWPGIIGQFMSYFPITLIIVLASSLFIALIIYPVLTGYLVRLESEPKKKRGVWAKRFGVVLAIIAALIIGLANPISLLSFGIVVAFFVLTYLYIVKPISRWFTAVLLPRTIENYKLFLRWMLERDYSVRYAFWRNAFSMISFTSGVVLLVLGALISGLAEASGYVLIIPGVILLVLGILGIIIHSVESVFIGGKYSVIGAIAFALIVSVIIGIVYLVGRDITMAQYLGLMMFPAGIAALGLLGMIRRSKKPLILTDNRSRLVNLSFGALFAIVGMFTVAPTGVTFFPDVDPSQIRVNIEGPIGMNLEATNRIAHNLQGEVDQMMRDYPEAYDGVENVLVNSGVALGTGPPSPNEARITLNMVDYGDRTESSSVTMNRIREMLQDIPDVFIQIQQEDMGPPTGLPVEIEISGPDFNQIISITEDMRNELLNAVDAGEIRGLTDLRDNVTGGIPEYEILIDSERANQYGLSLADVAQTISVAYEGVDASEWRDGEDEYDIRVRLREEDRSGLESLNNLTINTGQNQIPLTSIADFKDSEGLGVITRVDLSRTATIEGDAALGYSGTEVFTQVQSYLEDYELPAGYEIRFVGEAEDQAESFEFLSVALGISFALIFLIILGKFNNINVPFIIVTAVGLSLIGVLLGLTLSRTMFGAMTFVGVISLAGIVCINNIVLVDYIKQMLDAGKNKVDAIVEAGSIRLRPVLLTATTTILGLVPLTFGINIDFVGFLTEFDPDFQLGTENTMFWGPMGITIISGLIFATFLTLVIVPVIYSVMDSFANRLGKVWRGE